MPTKKQRRRRLKSQRHDYEVVYLDAEGNEIEPPPDAAGAPRSKAAARPKSSSSTRTMRPVQPASWRRVGKRALFFAPLMFVLMAVLEPDTSIVQRLAFTAQLLLLFLPFSYLLDRATYRIYQRRVDREAGGPAAKTG